MVHFSPYSNAHMLLSIIMMSSEHSMGAQLVDRGGRPAAEAYQKTGRGERVGEDRGFTNIGIKIFVECCWSCWFR